MTTSLIKNLEKVFLTDNTVKVNLSDYFEGSNIEYTYYITNQDNTTDLNPDSDVIIDSDSFVHIKGNYRNKIYNIGIIARNKNFKGLENEKLYIIIPVEEDIKPITVKSNIDTVLLKKDAFEVDLYTYFDGFVESFVLNVYTDAYKKEKVNIPNYSIIQNKTLRLQGSYLNKLYVAEIIATNRKYKKSITFLVVEDILPVKLINNGLNSVETTIFDGKQYYLAQNGLNEIDLSNYIQGSNLEYIKTLDSENNVVIDNNLLRINGNYRNKSYTIKLTASNRNKLGNIYSITETLNIYEKIHPPKLLQTVEDFSILYDVYNIPLSTYFDFINSVSFVVKDENNNIVPATDHGVVFDSSSKVFTITGQARKKKFFIDMNVQNESGELTYRINFTENPPSPQITNGGLESVNVKLTDNKVYRKIPLSSYFTDASQFVIKGNYNNAKINSNNELEIIGEFSGNNYTIEIEGINVTGSVTSFLNIEEITELKLKPSLVLNSSNIFKNVCASSNSDSLALSFSGQVYNWTDNVLRLSQNLNNVKILTIKSGLNNTFMINVNNDLYAWGTNEYGQLTIDNSTSVSTTPILCNNGSLLNKDVKSASCGEHHFIALDFDNKVHVWGGNDFGQLGNNTNIHSFAPTMLDTSIEFVQISTGSNHNVGIDINGKLYSWGLNNHGQLGTNNYVNYSSPTIITTFNDITSIACGIDYNLAIDTYGKVIAWGRNNHGQLGNNTIQDSKVPIYVSKFGSLYGKTIVSVFTKFNTSFAIDSDGNLHGWGSNENNVLGSTSSLIPMIINHGSLNVKRIISLDCSIDHVICIDDEQHLHTWGYRVGSSTSINVEPSCDVILYNANTATINLLDYFENLVTSEIVYNPFSNVTKVDENTISITGSNKNESYYVNVKGINDIQEKVAKIIIVEYPLYPDIIQPFTDLTLSTTNEVFIDLSTYFSSVEYFTIVKDSFVEAYITNNNRLKIIGMLRGISYIVDVIGYNSVGQVTSSINVTESLSSPSTVELYKYIKLFDNNIYTIDLNDYFYFAVDYVLENNIENVSIYSNILEITGTYNGTTYTFNVIGSNNAGSVSLQFTVEEDMLDPSLVLNFDSNLIFSNDIISVTLTDYVLNATNYEIISNPQSNFVIDGFNLQGNSTATLRFYSVIVRASNKKSFIDVEFLIEDPNILPSITNFDTIIDVRNDDVIIIDLGTYFKNASAFVINAPYVYTLDENILTIPRQYNNETYNITVTALPNIELVFTIIEYPRVIKLKDTTLSTSFNLENLLPLYINITDYIENGVEYSIINNPYNNAVLSGTLLEIQGDYRGLSYNILVKAFDGFSESIDITFVITEAAPLPSLNISENTELQNEIVFDSTSSVQYIDLSTYFTSTDQPITISPIPNARIEGNILIIENSLSDNAYQINIQVGNESFDLNIYEKPIAVSVKANIPSTYVTINNNDIATLDLSLYFDNANVFTVNSEVKANFTYNDNILQIYGEYIPDPYTITVIASNSDSSTDLVFNMQEYVVPILKYTKPIDISIVDTTPVTIDLNSYIIVSDYITYAIYNNPYLNASLSSNILTIQGNTRGSIYTIDVRASNSINTFVDISFVVNEIGAKPSLSSGGLESFGEISLVDTYTINLSLYFSDATLFTCIDNNVNAVISDNILTIYKTFTSSLYTITIKAINSYGTVESTLSVRELALPNVESSASISFTNLNTKSLVLTDIFEGVTSYNIQDNPYNNLLQDGPTILTVYSSSSIDKSYSIVLECFNLQNQSSIKTINITETYVQVPSQVSDLAIEPIATEEFFEIDLSLYFSNVDSFIITENSPYYNATIVDNKLIIKGNNIDDAYNIKFVAVSGNQVIEKEVNIVQTLPTPTLINNNIQINLVKDITSIDVSQYTKYATNYIVSTPRNNILLNGSILEITNEYSNNTYNCIVSITNDNSYFVDLVFVIQEGLRAVSLKTNFDLISLTNNTVELNLADYFSDATNYSIYSNPYLNGSINLNKLVLVGSYRNKSYNVQVKAYNKNSFVIETINVEESLPPVKIPLKSRNISLLNDTFERIYLPSYVYNANTFVVSTNPQNNASIVDAKYLLVNGQGNTLDYTVEITAFNTISSEIVVFNISEYPTQVSIKAPIPNIILAENIEYIDLTNYFNDATSYSILKQYYNTHTIEGNNLKLLNRYSNITYTVTIQASSLFKEVIQSFSLTEKPKPPTVINELGTCNLISNTLTFKLSEYFSGNGITYNVISQTYDNFSIDATTTTLSLIPQNIVGTYTLTVEATNEYGLRVESVLTVIENSIKPSLKTAFELVVLSTNTVTYNLNNYFDNADSYSFTANPMLNAVIDNVTNTLSVTGKNIDASYSIIIKASNIAGYTLATLPVREKLAPPQLIKNGLENAGTITLTNNTVTIPLSEYYAGIASLISYEIVSQHSDFNASINQSTLTIVGDYRDTSYTITVQAKHTSITTGEVSDVVTSSLSIVEKMKPPGLITGGLERLGDVVLTNETLTYNMNEFVEFASTYTITVSPYGNANISNGILYITGENRDIPKYIVSILCENDSGSVITSITLDEYPIIPTLKGTGLNDLSIVLSTSTPEVVILSNYYDGSYIRYEIIGNSYNAIISNNTLVITNEYRNITYSIEIQASNKSGSVSSSLTVEEYPPVPTLKSGGLESLGTVELSNTPLSYNIFDYFLIDGTYTYSIDPVGTYDVSIANDMLSINSSNTNTSYVITVTLTNKTGSVSSSISISELEAVSTQVATNYISAGMIHSMILAADKKIYMFGFNNDKRLGFNDTRIVNIPTLLNTGSIQDKLIKNINCKIGHHSMALDYNNVLHSWGNNDFGKVGVGKSDNVIPLPTQILTDVSDFATGIRFSAALKNNQLYMWGSNQYGTLGISDMIDKKVPTFVNTGSIQNKNIIAIACGQFFAVVLDDTNQVHAWGFNGAGQVGNGTNSFTVYESVPNLVKGDVVGKTIVKISCGDSFAAALDINGKVYTWGNNGAGQLGLGHYSHTFVSTKVASIDNYFITDISCGTRHVLAIDTNKQVFSWGSGQNGRLGHNSTGDKTTPQLINFGSIVGKQIIQVSAGEVHSLALDIDGNVHGWGNNGNNQLGISISETLVPIQLYFNVFDIEPVYKPYHIPNKTIIMYDHYTSDWGLTVPDSSGNNRTMTFNTPPAIDSTTDATIFRSSIFDGSSSTIYGTSQSFSADFSLGWTVEITFMVTSAVSNYPTVWQGPMGRMQLNNNGSGFDLWDGSNSSMQYSSIELNQWYTVVMLSNGTYYVNGIMYTGTVPINIGLVPNTIFEIGMNTDTTNPNRTFTGKIASFTVLNIIDTSFAASLHNNRISGMYPPGAMTGPSTVFTDKYYGNGTYIVSASSYYGGGYDPYRAFDLNTGTWYASSPNYLSNGTYANTVTTTVSGIDYLGEWIQMEFPTEFILKGYVIWPDSQYNASRPMKWIICGSSDELSWTLLHSQTTNGWSITKDIHTVPDNTTKFKYIRMIFLTNNMQGSGWTGFRQISFF